MFPARVTLADGTVHDPCRVATDTAGVTHAWAWIDGGPVEVGAWPADELVRADGGMTRRPTGLTAADGTTLELAKGCGCSHPLKGWRPALVVSRA